MTPSSLHSSFHQSVLAGMLAATAAVITACVTINVYFPAAAAEKAADRIIDDVWGPRATPPQSAPEPVPESVPAVPPTSSLGDAMQRLAVGTLGLLVAPAQAADPDIDVSSPEIARIKTQMERRFSELKPFLDNGLIGLGADGYVAVRDPSAVPLPQRNTVRTVVGNENADRAALYREIAVANGQPQWESQIREVFASRWIAKAAPGWWYQDVNGDWKQK